jgi:hypothetical protein
LPFGSPHRSVYRVAVYPIAGMTWSRWAFAAVRVGLGIAMITATFAALSNYLVYWHRIGLHDLGLRTANFFSAFTFEVNLLGAGILLLGAGLVILHRGPDPRWFADLRLCLVAALVLTGIVYNVLLRPLPVHPGEQVDWANEVLHVVAPAGVALDWLLAPHPPRLPVRTAALVAIYPTAWAAYTLVRGANIPDELAHTPYYYPYPFLNPHLQGGWGPVLQMIVLLTACTFALGLLAVLAWRLEDRWIGHLPPIRAA